MADHEVAKHTKKMYKIWNSSEHGVWHKFKEFFIEISIIVFAVSVSIWFHNMSEKRHERAEGHKFLVGLKSDLEKDIIEMKSDSNAYHEQLQGFIELTDMSIKTMDIRFISEHKDIFTSTIVLIPNIS
jgi:Fe2+ transport system protein B